jgi:hypothetical protein
MRKLADCMYDREASAALESVASLYRANDQMQIALKGMLAVQTGTEKASSDMDDEKKGLKAFRDDASVDTLIGSLDDEMFDEKKTAAVPATSRAGFFKRFLAKRQQKRSAKLTHVANEKLSKANKKIDRRKFPTRKPLKIAPTDLTQWTRPWSDSRDITSTASISTHTS